MKKGLRITIILVIILAAVAAGGYFGYRYFQSPAGKEMLTRLKSRVNPGDNPEEQEEKFSVPVAVSRVRTAEMRETLLLYGTIYPEKEVNIFSTVTGKVKQILAREGDRVRKDQVLAEIDRDQAGLKFAVAEVTSTIDGIVKTVMTQEGAMVGDEVFRSDDRQPPIFLGTTGAKAAAATSTVRGDVWLTVTHNATTYAGTTGVQ